MSKFDEKVEFLNSLFKYSCVGVFESIGFNSSVSNQESVDLESVPTSRITAKNDDLEISLLIAGPYKGLELTYPDYDKDKIKNSLLLDWLGEISNRLMGDLKNRLVVYDHRMNIGTPVVDSASKCSDLGIQGSYQKIINFCINLDEEIFVCTARINIINKDIEFIESDLEFSDTGELEMF
jgi:hypothetical protein